MSPTLFVFLLICSSFFSGILAFLIGLRITRKQDRNYSVLISTEEIAGQKIIDIAEKYRPIFYQSETIKYEIEFIFFEIIEKNDKLILIYRPVWPDEKHPNPIFHFLYKFFRWFYYGSVKDIEFVELVISKRTGEILSFSFEKLAHDSALTTPEHEFTTIVRKGNYFYNETKNNKLTAVQLSDSHIVLQVTTWNHLLNITKKAEGKKFNPPLQTLNDQQFRNYAISRRSSGYIKAKTNKRKTYFVSFLFLIFFGICIPTALYFLIR
jgi:hypothetical protein